MPSTKKDTFSEIIDVLNVGVPLMDIAAAMGCSVSLIKQARVRADAAGKRSPPVNWRRGARDLLRARIKTDHAMLEALLKQADVAKIVSTRTTKRRAPGSRLAGQVRP